LFHALGLKDHHIDHQMDDIAHQTFIKSSYFCPKAQELPSLINPPITFFVSSSFLSLALANRVCH
jgi:hypothetical protein